MIILQWFIKNFPSYVEKMQNCSYHYDKENLNRHHIEGDVWSHTVASLSNAKHYNYSEQLKTNQLKINY